MGENKEGGDSSRCRHDGAGAVPRTPQIARGEPQLPGKARFFASQGTPEPFTRRAGKDASAWGKHKGQHGSERTKKNTPPPAIKCKARGRGGRGMGQQMRSEEAEGD